MSREKASQALRPEPPSLLEKKIQIKTCWQKNLLHECFSITDKDHGV
jgi:hypothetical protein